MVTALLSLTGCLDAFDEVMEKVDAVQNAIDIGTQMGEIEDVIGDIQELSGDADSLTPENLEQVNTSLNQIEELLSNDATAEIVKNYAENAAAEGDINLADATQELNDYLGTLESDNGGEKDQIKESITNILNLLDLA